MKGRSRLVWKLIAVVAIILAAAITFSGYVNNLICAHYSLASARAFLRFNSESIVSGISQQMMSRNNKGIQELLGKISRDSTVYGDIRLVSHHSGRVAASRFEGGDTTLELEDASCAVCHDRGDLSETDTEIADMVIDDPETGRILSVVTPIVNAPGCRTADCHAHSAGPPILGFLTADYSLQPLDAVVASRKALIAGTVLVSLTLAIVALWIMFTRLLGRPIRGLIAGTERIAANELDFRFDQEHTDEIGVLETSFNAMTTRIQAHQDELRRAMSYLEGVIENSADIIITVTPDGFIETFNRGAEVALGYRRSEVIGQRIEMLFADPQERDVAIAQLDGVDNVKNYETHFLTKGGEVRNVLLTLSRLRDRDGNPIGTFGISKDVTEEKKLQRELIRSQKFAAIGQAVTGVQHAIKNMLSALTGGAYLVRVGLAKDNRQHIQDGWTMVEEGVKQIDKLSRDMLHYAKEWKPALQKVDLSDLVGKLCDLNRQTAADKGVALRHEAREGLPAVACDPEMIHMAATDLLVNAIDACTSKDYRSGESPEVVLRLSLTENGDSCVVEVSDNGCGMKAEIQRSIFTPFFSTKEAQGTGLGLALTSRIINVHGGSISVESEPRRGTTFRFDLPLDGPREGRETFDGQAGSRD